jgi:NAD(P)-dependent dehydrogenase (short-subunit alcohol dehydrogenase family)
MDLSNRNVLVVGGGSGIGLGIARAVRAHSANVVLAGRTPDKLARAAESLGGAHTVVADVTREDDVARLFASAPSLDHVVVTAVDVRYGPVASLDIDGARRALESKLVAALLVAKHGAPRLRPGGSITLTGGIAADRPMPGGSLAATMNGGIHAFVRAAAIELAPVRVNALSPGWVDTEVWEVIGPGKGAAFEAMAKRLPAGRIGAPEDMGHAAVFLMESEFTTGEVLHVDGGHRLV